MNSKRVSALFIIVIILVLAAACGQQGQESDDLQELVQPTVEPVPEKHPFEGIWFEQDRGSMLIITAETVYLHEFDTNREVYARIDEVDNEAEIISVFITNIMFGGKPVGYDSPNVQIRYHVNGTVMDFWGQHIDFSPDEEGPVIYILDEFLNSGEK